MLLPLQAVVGVPQARAAAALTVRPLTWDVVGLRSNNVNNGPNEYSVGARVCNTGDQTATNATATFVWDSPNQYINLSGPSTIAVGSLAAGSCRDVYFSIIVQKTTAAFETFRRYHIEITADGLGTVSTPTPRQIYVEKLISQNRNSIDSITGPSSVVVGQTYTFTVKAKTATQGYEQLTTYIPLPSSMFQLQSVNATYSSPAGGTNDTIYADACGWDPRPSSPTYLSCIGPPKYAGGKAGGTITLTYNVLVVGQGTTSLSAMIYDFSGSSFHYNSDYGNTVLAVSATLGSPPVAVDDSVSVSEDASATFSVLGNDSDPDGNLAPSTLAATSSPAHGTLTKNADNTFTYTPNPDYHGPDSFTYQICDTANFCSTATVSITVTPVNDPPVAVNDTATTPEDTPVAIPVLANDTDVDGDSLTVNQASSPGHGTVAINGDGTVTYTPDANYSGADTFDYEACDPAGQCANATVTVTINPVNDPPLARNDVISTDEDVAVVVPVLDNDTDVDGTLVLATLAVSTNPTNGTASVNADGTITYTPNSNYDGTDTFEYQICDNDGACSTATVTVNINSRNDPPTAVDDTATTDEDTPVVVPVLANDTDPDTDTLTVTQVNDPAHGTATINADNTIFYTPDANYSGTDSFEYEVCDPNGACDTGTVVVTVAAVNDLPVARNDLYTTAEDVVLVVTAPGVLGNDTDVDGDSLTVTGHTQPSNGAVAVAADGSFTYTPDANFNGTDTFTYDISDGNGGTATATVTINVNPINDTPTANDDSYSTDEDTPLTIAAPGLLTNDSDPDGQTLNVGTVSDPANGTASVNPDGSFTYTPDPDFWGTDTFTYQACDPGPLCDTATVTINVAAVNDPPIAADDIASTDEDTPITIDVLHDDIDPDGTIDPASVTIDSDPSNGSAVVNADGTITYTPGSHFHGTDTFIYQVCDNDGACDTASVEVEVSSINDPPVANDDSVSTQEDTAVTVPVLANDVDPDGDTLTVIDVTDPGHGTVGINADGTVTYTPDPNYTGADSFTYQVCDPDGACDTAVVIVVDVTAVNDAPTARDDLYATNEDTPLVVGSPGVLTNDSDVEGDALTVTGFTQPSHGTVAVNADGSFTYTPEGDYSGPDSFTYTVSDGTDSSTATVRLTVNPVNDAPTAVDDTATTDENTPVTIPVLGNDTDLEGNTLTITGISDPGNGTAVVNPGGTVTYTPQAGFSGTDTFTYTIDDGNGGTDTATVTVTVNPTNDDPIANDDVYSAAQDTPLAVAAPGLLGNDTDPEGDSLTVTGNTQPTNGTVAVSSDGSFTYTPNSGFSGVDSFSYDISDGNGGTASATATIDVAAVNGVPVAVDDTATTDEDTPVAIAVLDNDTDPDGDTLTVQSVTQPANGTVVNNGDTVTYTPNANFSGTDTFTYTIDDSFGGTDTATVTVTVDPTNDDPTAVDDPATTDEDTAVTIPVLANDTDPENDSLTVTAVSDPPNGTAVINAGQTVTYTPDANFTGTDTFTYTISDGNGGTDTATVTVTVNPTNDDPVANPDAHTTSEDTAIIIPFPGLLGNDTDPDGDTLTVTGNTQPANGTVTVNANGSFIYTPAADYHGTDTFTYTISDGNGGTATGTVTITVTPVNDPPVAVDDTDSTPEDTPVTIPVLGNDTDIEGDTLSVALITQPANGATVDNGNGTVTYTPNANFAGTDTFTYRVCDDGTPSACDEGTVTVTVNPENDPPVARDDLGATDEDTAVTLTVLGNDTDPENNSLTVTAVSDPPNGTAAINADGTVTYTPDTNFTGTDTFTYTISDGNGGTATATVTVAVAALNDRPIAVDDPANTDEDTPVDIPVLANDTDPEGDALTVQSVTQPANGTTTINAGGTITYTPNADYHGTDTFTYQVCDDGVPSGCDTATVTVTVTPVNDPPVAVDDTATTVEDTPVDVAVLANDSDPEGDSLTVTRIMTDPTNGATTINADNTITYTPNPNFSGVDAFEYEISDGNGGTDTAWVSFILVNPVNDDPTAVADNANTDEDTPVDIPILANDTDPENDPLTVQSVTQPANGTTTINAGGTVTYTPDPNFTGTDSFTYTISDGNGGTDTGTVTITIDPINDDPVAVDDSATTDEDTPITIPAPGVLGNDSDIDGDTLSVTANTDPANGTVTVNADGSYSYAPDANFNGTDSFDYTISDGNGGTATATVTITVDPTNDDPTAVDDPATTDENTAVTIPVLANDSDLDADTLTVQSVTQPANGTVVNNGATVTYTPDTNFSGTDTFTYTISDGNGGTATATVTVAVALVNDSPTAVADAYSATTNTPLTIPAPGVLGNDSDPDGDTLTVTGSSQPANGSVSVNPDGSFTYTPDAGFSGVDTFTYTISDGNGGSATATVTLNVTPVIPPGGSNDPVATVDSATTDEDAAVVIAVLGNDSDPNGDPLTVQSVTPPANGTVIVNADGTITYTPAKDYHGTESFSYTISDGNGGTGTATVTVTVNPINDAPVAIQDTASTAPGTPVVVSVLVNDSDADGDPLTVTAVSKPGNGTVSVNTDGTITYTPAGGFTGIDTFTYTVSDGKGSTATATVAVAVGVTNGPPTLTNNPTNRTQTVQIGQTLQPLTATDPDGDTFSFVLTAGTLPPGVTLNPDGTFTGIPTSTGIFSATITVCDSNGLCSSGVLSLQVVTLGELPFTGVDSHTLALTGLLMTVLGAVLVATSRRRRERGV